MNRFVYKGSFENYNSETERFNGGDLAVIKFFMQKLQEENKKLLAKNMTLETFNLMHVKQNEILKEELHEIKKEYGIF